MDARSRGRVREHLLKRAGDDPEFREQLLRDPYAAVRVAFGMELPEGLELDVLQETPQHLYVVLPPLPPGRNAQITLREVTQETVRTVCNLEVAPEQKGFVASNSVSIAEAHFTPTAWFRAIYADETPVGFVMLSDDPEKPEYYLWRYMIGAEYQGMGFGKRALEQVIDYVRTRPNASELLLSFVPGEGSPRDFYARLGFRETGDVHGGEVVMRLAL